MKANCIDCSLSLDPVESLLAIGTEEGRIYIFGKNGVELNWNLTSSSRIKFLCFKSNYLLVLGEYSLAFG